MPLSDDGQLYKRFKMMKRNKERLYTGVAMMIRNIKKAGPE